MENISFSRLTRDQKIEFIGENLNFSSDELSVLNDYWYQGLDSSKNLENISENVISNYLLPFSVAPGFLINGNKYTVPMVTEESSVVAAAASAAKFWSNSGGFETKVISMLKTGQIHFNWSGQFSDLQKHIPEIKVSLINSTASFLNKMEKRGGGIRDIEFLDFSNHISGYFQIKITFDTVDAMGANIINTCLEAMSFALKDYFFNNFTGSLQQCDVLMSILSNYTPDCLVESSVSCKITDFQKLAFDMEPETFAKRFMQAVNIAKIDVFRAVTHNKGIFNGIDAVLLATGNDFRATEAGGHSYAARNGSYQGLTSVELSDGVFRYSLRIPLAIGTVGGLTSIHPMVHFALKLMGSPTAHLLMQIATSVGLANNFSAIRALVSTGIQKGHMKFHLFNLLKAFNASDLETSQAIAYFDDKTVSNASVEAYLMDLRNGLKV